MQRGKFSVLQYVKFLSSLDLVAHTATAAAATIKIV
jgi:hypothetical protein